MNKKYLAITICIQVICFCVMVWLLTQNSVPSVEAHVLYQEATATPTPTPVLPFLGPIYYGEEYVWKVFDHQLPLDYAPFPLEPGVRHYDYSFHNPPTSEYGYDGHIGIDYSLEYEPVLASADGVVDVADWSNSANHRLGYGLHVVMSHDANADYTTIYGHLSTLNVETGDVIEIDLNDPGNRDRIIGISGNTGHVFNDANNDCAPIPISGANCGQHLHFETRRNGVVVNPYGWISSTPDPWALHEDGTVSHYLWANQPAALSTQYINSGPSGTQIVEPAVNNARMIIDDASADFSHYLQYPHEGESGLPPIPPECGQIVPNEDAYNGSYRQISANTFPMCQSYWHIRPDAFTPPGAYDVFVHIPPGNGKTLGAEYTIRHNRGASTAVLVQAAYPNDEHDSWVYIGRYEFAMQPGALEYIKLSNQTTVAEVGVNPNVVADAVMLAPAEASPPPVAEIYVSFASDGVVGNIAYADEDILMYDTATADWSLVFDGSDVGLANRNVDGFDFQEGDIYLSLNWSDKTQLYRFSPTSLSEETAGDLQVLFFSEELLDEKNEDVDGFSFAPGGSYLFSTVGTADTKGGSFNDEDLFSYTHRPDGYEGGAFALYWQGAAAGLTNESEDINGIWLDTFTNKLYLTTTGPFSTPATSGDGADIFACYTSGECENGRYWNGSAHGLGAAQVDGLSLMSFPVCTRHGGILNCSFESGFNDWDVQPGSPDTESWTLSGADAHTGQYSALAQATFPDSGDSGDGAILQSPLIPINSTNKEYRFNFYVKTIDNDGWQFRVDFSVNWYLNGGYIGETILNPINVSDDFDWHLKGQTVFVCPAYVGANGARIVFEVSDISLVGTSEAASTSNQLFLDDVIVESRPSICPLLNQ